MSNLPVRSMIPCRPVNAVVSVPGSKSLTNRALLIAALSGGESSLTGALNSEDTQLMAEAIRLVGGKVTAQNFAEKIVVSGEISTASDSDRVTEIYVGNSGTTARFLTAALSFIPGRWRIHGKDRMHRRPIGALIDALTALGADVESETENGCPPIRIRGQKISGGLLTVRGDVSSQFLSGLLMAAPLADGNVTIRIEGELVSKPYVAMTLAVMKSFGVEVVVEDDYRSFFIPAQARYQPTDYVVEPDASAASYFFALPAIVGGRMTVRGLTKTSLQGDVDFVEILKLMGCRVFWNENETTVIRDVTENGQPAELVGVDVDMNDISDTVQTLSVVALFAVTPTRIRNVAHIRGKETDRIAAVVTELGKLGVRVDEFDDGLQIWPDAAKMHGAQIATYDDHRMAMSFALAGLVIPGVKIENPDCVVKTYPQFFDDLDRAVMK